MWRLLCFSAACVLSDAASKAVYSDDSDIQADLLNLQTDLDALADEERQTLTTRDIHQKFGVSFADEQTGQCTADDLLMKKAYRDYMDLKLATPPDVGTEGWELMDTWLRELSSDYKAISDVYHEIKSGVDWAIEQYDTAKEVVADGQFVLKGISLSKEDLQKIKATAKKLTFELTVHK